MVLQCCRSSEAVVCKKTRTACAPCFKLSDGFSAPSISRSAPRRLSSGELTPEESEEMLKQFQSRYQKLDQSKSKGRNGRGRRFSGGAVTLPSQKTKPTELFDSSPKPARQKGRASSVGNDGRFHRNVRVIPAMNSDDYFFKPIISRNSSSSSVASELLGLNSNNNTGGTKSNQTNVKNKATPMKPAKKMFQQTNVPNSKKRREQKASPPVKKLPKPTAVRAAAPHPRATGRINTGGYDSGPDRASFQNLQVTPNVSIHQKEHIESIHAFIQKSKMESYGQPLNFNTAPGQSEVGQLRQEMARSNLRQPSINSTEPPRLVEMAPSSVAQAAALATTGKDIPQHLTSRQKLANKIPTTYRTNSNRQSIKVPNSQRKEQYLTPATAVAQLTFVNVPPTAVSPLQSDGSQNTPHKHRSPVTRNGKKLLRQNTPGATPVEGASCPMPAGITVTWMKVDERNGKIKDSLPWDADPKSPLAVRRRNLRSSVISGGADTGSVATGKTDDIHSVFSWNRQVNETR